MKFSHHRRPVALITAVALFAAAMTGCSASDEVLASSAAEVASEPAPCVSIATDDLTVPRLWIDATLEAIRADFPAPTVHARNLWHVSAVMWDAHAVYDDTAVPYFAAEVAPADDVTPEAEATAISFAAYRLLTARYEFSVGGFDALDRFDQLMADLCLDLDDAPVPLPGSPAAIGLAIAEAAIDFGLQDGSAEQNRYLDFSYEAVNPPLVVNSDIIEMNDPNRWQPLELAVRITQNGQSEGAGVQTFIGSNWGAVTSFALPPATSDGITLDPGPPPLLGTATSDDFVQGVVGLLQYSDWLGGETGAELIDIGPASRGNAPLGDTRGVGHPVNPTTSEPYEPNLVPHGDYGRTVAEYWADGPDSETPPGHWNALAITTTEQLAASDLRWGGDGELLSRHDWDLQLFFVLNASLHDAAIVVWGAKRAYDYARPISMVRYLGTGNDGGLPVVPGLIETVTEESSADDGRHRRLPVGATAVRSWMGPVMDPESQLAGVDWRPAIDWIPYQRPTFVSPAFAAYPSGHSGFSRAGADILTMVTGSRYFPGGVLTHTTPAGLLLHEEGPSVDVELQWATYQDAADEAGESRRYGGIHVEADDIAGRFLGAEVATLAWEKAQLHFG